jgi:hypothetical protein
MTQTKNQIEGNMIMNDERRYAHMLKKTNSSKLGVEGFLFVYFNNITLQ